MVHAGASGVFFFPVYIALDILNMNLCHQILRGKASHQITWKGSMQMFGQPHRLHLLLKYSRVGWNSKVWQTELDGKMEGLAARLFLWQQLENKPLLLAGCRRLLLLLRAVSVLKTHNKVCVWRMTHQWEPGSSAGHHRLNEYCNIHFWIASPHLEF